MVKHFYVYRVDHIDTNEFYIGSRGCKCLPEEDIKYKGSMTSWKPDRSKLIKTILEICNTREHAFEREVEIMSTLITNPLNRNYFIPGIGYHVSGRVTVIDKDGNTMSVSTDDPRYKNGELQHICKGRVIVKDKNGKSYSVSINDEKYLNGTLKPMFTGLVAVKDSNGNKFNIDKNDPQYLSGEIKSLVNGTTIVLDKMGNKFRVNSDDIRIKNGELVGHTKGMITVKDSNGKTQSIHIDDPRYKNGELLPYSKNMIVVKDKSGKIFSTYLDDPLFLSGELISINKGRIKVRNKDGKKMSLYPNDKRITSGEYKIYDGPLASSLAFLEQIKKYLLIQDKEIFTTKELVGSLNRNTFNRYMSELIRYKYIIKLKTSKNPRVNGWLYKLNNE